MTAFTPPKGFSLLIQDGSFNDTLQPFYIRMDAETGPEFGLRVEKNHTNPMGICHGAVYMAMFDFSLAGKICFEIGKFTGTPTININIDYLASSKSGEWIYTETECLKLTNTMGFAKGIIRSDTEIKASGTGIFKLPKDIENAEGISIKDYMALKK